jgi:CspA family cold shock protein
MADSEIIATELLGKIKWFNNKSGYGFITATTGDYLEKDIFVHYSAIRVTNTQYRYLVQGEYVQFDLVKSNSGKHEYQAANVTGVSNGELMCETRRNSRNESNAKRTSNTDADADGVEKRKRPTNNRRRKPVSSNKVELATSAGDEQPATSADDGEFKKVEKKRKPRGPRPSNKDKNV